MGAGWTVFIHETPDVLTFAGLRDIHRSHQPLKASAMIFVPDLSVIIQFGNAIVIVALTPGPDIKLFVGRALKIAGALYLVRLAYQAVRHGSAFKPQTKKSKPVALAQHWMIRRAIRMRRAS
jgi:threonine/homoserine/homoserine lactone efflux protein